ncbi:MAG TPA: aldehyde dehydrogenase family protein, partial [Microthrixaceae bacterium]|nr:aldehyde dehydrogenase family protein [Microthrixaceae bacterium]
MVSGNGSVSDKASKSATVGEPAASGSSKVKRTPLPASLTTELKDHLSKLVSGASASAVIIDAPFSGQAMVELPQCTPADVLQAADLARVAQRRWAKVDIAARSAIFLRLHDLVLAERETLMDLIQAENGKARRDAFLEVADIANTCRYYARTAARLLRPQRRSG